MINELPSGLAGLRDQLREAASREIEIEARVRSRLRRRSWRRVMPVASVAAVAIVGVAVAQRALDREGVPLPADRLPAAAVAGADSGIVVSSATRDPAGGPRWALRVFTNPAGEDCFALGRLRGGRLGTYVGSRTFRAQPSRVLGPCDSLGRVGLLVALRYYGGGRPRTVVYGLARDRRPVHVTIRGMTSTIHPQGLGSFIAVRRGLVDKRGAIVSTKVGNRTVHRRLIPR
jgi:hypothetical protein